METNAVKFTLPPLETPLLKAGVEFNANSAAGGAGGAFEGILGKSINNLRDVMNQSAKLTEEYASGGDVDISEVMVATEKAALATELAVQVRNKLLESYQEIMRTQI